ncbi:hypothetical protein EVAR_58154_1 [Eumeta japonica]|uniref:Uncharacterized protein n=1 Tax=Eumeta variegata TaxID=151549 RepID=A0A4C1X389_EUMVA|nr:hypothetical protein EVAR_58154_1 [Eumeta japonica]
MIVNSPYTSRQRRVFRRDNSFPCGRVMGHVYINYALLSTVNSSMGSAVNGPFRALWSANWGTRSLRRRAPPSSEIKDDLWRTVSLIGWYELRPARVRRGLAPAYTRGLKRKKTAKRA